MDCAPRPDQEPVSGEGRYDPILIVEDNSVNVMILRSMLRKHGLEPLVATDGAEGVALCQKHRPRLVLMDINMPKMDGLSAAEAIRDLGREDSPAIVAVTADASDEQREACRMAGFEDLLPKPLDLGDLMDTVRRWLR